MSVMDQTANHSYQAGKNFVWLSAAQLIVRLVGAAFYFLISFKLQATGLGQYNFISSFVPFWFLVIDFGAGDYLYREWSKSPLTKEQVKPDFNILFTTRVVVSLVVFLPFAIFNYYSNRSLLPSLLLFYASMFLAMIIHLNDLYLQSLNLFRFPSIRQVIEKGITVVIGTSLLMFRARLEYVFFAMLISQIASLGYYYLKVVTLVPTFHINWSRGVDLFKKGLPFMLIGLLSTIYARIDMVMLRYMDDFTTVGWYGAAYKFLDLSSLFSVLFMSAVFPIFSNIYNQPGHEQQYKDFFYKSFRIIFSFGVIIVLAVIFAAPLLISLFFPSSFSPSVLVLRILMVAQILIFLSVFFSNLLIVQGKEKKSLIIIAISAALNVALNIFLIPRFSLYGAAWATVIAETGNLLLLQAFVQWSRDARLLMKVCFVVAVNAALLICLKYFGEMNNLLIGSGVLIVNICILFACGLLSGEDIKIFFEPVKDKVFAILGADND